MGSLRAATLEFTPTDAKGRVVWKSSPVAKVIEHIVRGKVVCDPFLGPGGLAWNLSPVSRRYFGAEVNRRMRMDFGQAQNRRAALKKVRVFDVDGYQLARVAQYEVCILDPPWGGWQVFLNKRYLLSRRNRRVVDLALHILRARRIVIFVLPYHAALPSQLERQKFFESSVIQKDGRDYCKVWAFRS